MGVYDVIGSGMTANKIWMDVTANNIANINTTRTKEGGPYHRQSVTFQEKKSFNEFLEKEIGGGVRADRLLTDRSERTVYNPEHADADAKGYVRMPSINMAAEMTNMMMAQQGYNANVTSFNTMKKANEKTFEIGKV